MSFRRPSCKRPTPECPPPRTACRWRATIWPIHAPQVSKRVVRVSPHYHRRQPNWASPGAERFKPARAFACSVRRPIFPKGRSSCPPTRWTLRSRATDFSSSKDPSGERSYTRAGQFQQNANGEIVNPAGHRLLGFGVDGQFQIDQRGLEPLSVPSGSDHRIRKRNRRDVDRCCHPTRRPGSWRVF